MSNTIKTYVGDGSTTIYTFNFDYIKKDFVKVMVDGVAVPFTLTDTYTVTLDEAPAVDATIVIQRSTDTARIVDFVDGSILIAKDLNLSALQSIHIAAEALDKAGGSLLIDDTGAYTAGFRRVGNLGDPVDDRDAVNKQWASAEISSKTSAAVTAAGEAQTARTGAEAAQAAAEAARDVAVSVDKVDRNGDTMDGDLSIHSDVDGTAGARIILGKSRPAIAPRAGDEIGSVFVRSIDPANSSIRSRVLVRSLATEDHDHAVEHAGQKGQLYYVTTGTSTGELAAEWNEDGFLVRANDSSRFMNTVALPLAWGAAEGNTATVNKAVFDALEAHLSGQVLDLASESLPVPAGQVPSGNTYQNGFLVEQDALGNADLSHPQLNTMLKATTTLTHGLCNSTWAQENACWDDGLREGFVAFTENNNHGVEDGSSRVVIMRSRDGLSWTREVVDLGFPCSVWGHRVYGGYQMITVRDESGGPSNGEFHLFGRQLAQRVEITKLTNSGAGDNRFGFELVDLADAGRQLMICEGSTVEFNGLPSNLGGLSLNKDATVTYRGANRVEFRDASNFTSAFNHNGIFEMNVLESDWQELFVTPAQVPLGQALVEAAGLTGQPVLVQGIKMWRDGAGPSLYTSDYASMGTIYVGISGGPFNAAVARVSNLMDTLSGKLSQVDWISEIPGANSQLSEVSVQTFPDTDNICGFVRTQDDNAGQTVPAAFFSTSGASSTSIGSVSLTNLPLGAFENSPITVTRLGDDLVAVASLERDADQDRGERRLALLKAPITDAFNVGAGAFKIIPFEVSEYSNHTLSGGGSGVGVPAITRWGPNHKTVVAFFNRETNSFLPGPVDTVTQIVATKIGFDPNPMNYHGPEHIGWGNIPEPEWRIKLRGTPAHGNNSVIQWENIDFQSAPHCYSAGVITFPVSGVYRVDCQMSYEPNTGTNFVKLVKGDGLTDFVTHETWLALAYNNNSVVSVQSVGGSSTTIVAKAGDTMAFKVNATGGTTDSTVRNFASVELVRMH